MPSSNSPPPNSQKSMHSTPRETNGPTRDPNYKESELTRDLRSLYPSTCETPGMHQGRPLARLQTPTTKLNTGGVILEYNKFVTCLVDTPACGIAQAPGPCYVQRYSREHIPEDGPRPHMPPASESHCLGVPDPLRPPTTWLRRRERLLPTRYVITLCRHWMDTSRP